MSERHCYYHPLEAARWQCRGCQRLLCSRCVPVNDKRTGHCPLCRAPLRYLGSANTAVPFWNRLGAFFVYPLGRAPLVLILICTLLPAFMTPGLLSLAVSLLLLAAQTRYLYAVLEHTSEGELSPPPLGVAFSGGGLMLVIQQVVIFVVMAVAVEMSARFLGPVAGVIVMLAVLLALPATVMLLALEGQLGEALNPLRWLALMSALKWPYFVLYGYLVLLVLGAGVVTDFMWQHFSPAVAQALAGMSASYLSIVAFHLMGYLLFQYQDRLGYAADSSEELPAEQGPRSDNETLRDVDLRLREGDFRAAAGALEGYVERHRQDTQQVPRLFRILVEMDDNDRILRLQRVFMEHFVLSTHAADLAELIERCRKADAGWLPSNAERVFQAAESLYQSGHTRLALWMLKDYHNRFANEPMWVADALLLTARILANHVRNAAKARNFLTVVAKRYPERAAKAQALLAELDQHGTLADGR